MARGAVIGAIQSVPCNRRRAIDAVQPAPYNQCSAITNGGRVCLPLRVHSRQCVHASLVANTPVARLLTVSASGCPQEELNHCAATRSVDLPGSVDRAFVLSCTFS